MSNTTSYGDAHTHVQKGGLAARAIWKKPKPAKEPSNQAETELKSETDSDEFISWIQAFKAGSKKIFLQVSEGNAHSYGLNNEDSQAEDWILL